MSQNKKTPSQNAPHPASAETISSDLVSALGMASTPYYNDDNSLHLRR